MGVVKGSYMHLGLDIDIGSLSPLSEGKSLDTNSGNPVNIALPKLQRETDSASTPASKLLSDYTIAQVENNSTRIDESVLKEDFYNTLDKKCQEEHHQNFEELSKQSLKSALEFQGGVYQHFAEEKAKLSEQQLVSTAKCEYPCIVTNCAFTHIKRSTVQAHLFKHIKVSQYYCEQCLPHTFFVRDTANLNRHIRFKHSTDSTLSKYGAKHICPPDQNTMNSFSECNVSQVSDQQQTDNASTPASKLLSDYIIAEVENNSNRIDESVLKEDFYNTLDKKCQEEHHQNFEELSKQSLKKALEFQGRVYQDFTKKKAKLSKKQLVSTDRFEYSCIVTNCVFTHINRIDVKTHLFKHVKVSQHYCEQCLPHTFFVRDTANLNRHIRSKHSTDSTLSKYGAKHICPPDQNTMNSFSECNVSQVSDQQQTDNASTPASKLLSDYTIAEVENNSNRIDESVLKEDFYNTLDKKCQEEHHQNFEELSKQSLKNALEFQGRVYQGFTKEKVNLSEKQLVSTGRYEYPCIVTDCSFTHKNRAIVGRHLFKHIKVSPHYCEQCFPNIFFVRDKTDLDKHKRSFHCLDKVISKRGIRRVHQRVQNTIVENNSNRIDESVLKEDFYNTLDKKCQEEHNQNFEELSKQSLKSALEFQGGVYQHFAEEKAKLSEQQLVSTDKCEYPCIVTNCAFTHIKRSTVQAHLFKHIKVSQYYCEQCLPHTFFVRDIGNLNRHKKRVHSLDTAITKRGIKRIHQPVQNTMNGSSGFTVNQESDPCSLLNSAKRAKTDP